MRRSHTNICIYPHAELSIVSTAIVPASCALQPKGLLKECCMSRALDRYAHAAARKLHVGVSTRVEPRAYVNDISLVCINPVNSAAYFV